MATRFMHKALLTAAMVIAPSLLLSATTTPSPTWCDTAGALAVGLPAPSNCRARTSYDRRWRESYIAVTWSDNSTNEDGFTLEAWLRNQSGDWVLAWSVNEPANSTGDWFLFFGRNVPQYRFRVRAFNAGGTSAWSNWAR